MNNMHKVGRQLVTGGLLNAKLRRLNIDCFNQLVYIRLYVYPHVYTFKKGVRKLQMTLKIYHQTDHMRMVNK